MTRTEHTPRALTLRLRGDALAFGAAPHVHAVRSVAAILGVLGEGHLDAARLETAIAWTEDLVMPVLRGLPCVESLVVEGEPLVLVPALLSPTAGAAVTIEAVEALFNDLADHVQGSPIAWRHAIDPRALAPALVILREVMHHGGFRCVSLSVDGEQQH